ncbi:sensor histidine kinase KdpD [Clostridium sp. SHJSY1]|uniref:sensor histidine kinase KdpD n=1 Tax=Clostridium sp. SHJSY1 TaxID=2942483 RepID=UPI002876291B|nr:sensor histidine kinase KdpD [Clostridium sp. SHJSY1]MDS0528457.1 sensor histidine kinase KdpD [Clostridium sp. SHJSY1]
MSDMRPDPDKLLKQINSAENKKGKLKIFFGYAAGVGKTYTMLDAAHSAQKAGIDVVVGYIEPHTRKDTQELLEGLKIIPPLKVPYKGIMLNEFDLDSALERKPEIILVDELAHTNVKGLRHTKRYSDIEELLNAGIDVYTTVNVQHIESLNDIVASITHIVVRERIPDRIFDESDQVELIDIEPIDLIERLNKGKIYKESQSKKALSNFFTKENLVALREIALRKTADRVNKEVIINKNESNNNYHTNEHILVCLSSSPSNPKVIRTAARMADAFHGKFTALFVQTIHSKDLEDKNIDKIRANLKLAEELGAEIATTYGDDVPYQIAEYAKVSGISKVVLGRTNTSKIFRTKLGFVDKLVSLAPDIDIYVIPDKDAPKFPFKKKHMKNFGFSYLDFLMMIGIMILCIILSFYVDSLGFSEANIITIFILGVLLISSKTNGKIYGVISSLIGVLSFDFFFIEPRLTFSTYDSQYIVTFLFMLTASIITSTLTSKVKEQADTSAIIAYRTNVLLDASRELQKANTLKEIAMKSQIQIYKLLKKPVVFYIVKNEKIIKTYTFKDENNSKLEEKYIGADEKAVVAWVIRNKKKAGVGTETLPGSKALYVPLIGQDKVLAVIGIVIENNQDIDSGEKSLYRAMLNQISFALEKHDLNEAQKLALMQAEKERFRANLLRAISHDLRTPLTSISGSANLLLTNNIDEESRKKLTLDIYDDSLWLINLVENLLSVSRIDKDGVNLHKEPQLVEEIITEALNHVNRKVKEHIIKVNLKDDLLMVDVDVRLIIQVIINIVDNAIKYTEPGSEININVCVNGEKVIMEIADNGEGISKHNKECIFDMFFTVNGNKGDSRRGLGLGLALCKSIINAHGGKIYVRDNKPQGTVFGFTLSLVEVKGNEDINFSSGR